MKPKTKKALIAALDALGVTGDIKLTENGDAVIITINSEYFGVWDAVKNNFIDNIIKSEGDEVNDKT